MAKRKSKWTLEELEGRDTVDSDATIGIFGNLSDPETVYVAIDHPTEPTLFVKREDLEVFAVNILKALKSKKLQP
jgi:hypothetical protein